MTAPSTAATLHTTDTTPPETGLSLAVISASVRHERVGRTVADWVAAHLSGMPGDGIEQVDLIDLAEIELPPSPELRPGGSARTAVTDRIGAADAYLIVTPEYNRSYPAALKELLDWHYTEWMFKAAALVSYGVGGGVFAAEHLRPVLTELQVVAARRLVPVVAPWDRIAEGRFVPDESATQALDSAWTELSWWARALKRQRTLEPFGSR